jgi:tetratricopeptide (TPR) repeat protein
MDMKSEVDMDSDSDIPKLTTVLKEEVEVIQDIGGASESFHFSTYEQQLESLLSPELIALTSTMSNWDISEVSSGGSYTLTEYQDMKVLNVLSLHTKQMDIKSDVDMDSDSDIPKLTTLSKEEVEVIQDISGASESFHFSTYEQQLESLLSPELIALTSTMSNWDISEVSSGGSYTLTEYQDMKVLNVLSLHTDRSANDKSASQSILKTHHLGQDQGCRSKLIHFKGTVIDAKKEGILAVEHSAGHGRGEHAALLVLLVSTSCFIGYIFCTLARRTVTSVRQWQRQRINLRISDLEFRAVQLMVDGEYGKAITALNAGLKYIVSVDGKQLHINSAGFKHLLGKALLGQEDYSAAEKTIRSLVSYYEGIATDDLHLAKLLEDLAMSLLYQGRREQEEAYGYLTRSLKIYETEMMLALRALGTEEGSFYGVNYHAQVYSARLIEDAIAGADVSCAIEADATSLPDCPEVFASCESKEEVELGECERAVAELDALLAAPVAIEVFSVKIPHSLESISRQIDVSRVRYEMGMVLELSERYEDAMMVIEEAHEVLAELTADISGVTEFAGEVSHIASLSLVMLKKIVFLERFLVVRDDSHGLISNGDRAQTGKVLETPPKRVRSTDKSYRESPDTVIF